MIFYAAVANRHVILAQSRDGMDNFSTVAETVLNNIAHQEGDGIKNSFDSPE